MSAAAEAAPENTALGNTGVPFVNAAPCAPSVNYDDTAGLLVGATPKVGRWRWSRLGSGLGGQVRGEFGGRGVTVGEGETIRQRAWFQVILLRSGGLKSVHGHQVAELRGAFEG
jgi:hypothetical protein